MDKIIVIVGPTGVGKTKLSISLAKKYDAEIISGDSMQVYKGMDIGTAKVKEDEKEGIVHHLIDIKEIDEDYSVYEFQQNVRQLIKKIQSEGKTVVIVGGTGLYLKAALYDYVFKKEDENKNHTKFLEYNNEELHEKLKKVDPSSASKLHPNNRRRVIRALILAESGNLKSKIISKQKHKPIYDIVMIGLTTSTREELYNLINKRVDKMFNEGLLEETKKIHQKYAGKPYNSLQAIGYKEVFTYLDGKNTLEEAKELLKRKTRNYAKRQYTWFKNQFDVNWFYINIDNFNKTIDDVFNFLEKQK